MVVVLKHDEYSLTNVGEDAKLLILSRKSYLWTKSKGGKETLTRINKPIENLPAPYVRAKYWFYNVIHNTDYTPGLHLSLVNERGNWDAYILKPKLPVHPGDSCEITATDERITKPRASYDRLASTNVDF